MSDNLDVTATIKVKDEATGPIEQIERGLGSMANAARSAGASMGRAFSGLKSALGQGAFGGVAQNLSATGSAFGRLSSAIKSVVAPMAALAGIGAGFGVADAVTGLQEYVNTAAGLPKAARNLGTTVESLDAMRYAAAQAGIGVEDFDAMMTKANVNIRKAATGQDKGLAGLFAKAKIPMKDAAGQLRPMADMMREWSQALGRQTSPAVKSAAAIAIFGKAGADMVKLLGAGTPAFDAWINKAFELGVVTTEGAGQAAALRREQKGLNDQWAAMTQDLKVGLVPAITELVSLFGAWFKAHRPEITERLTAAMLAFADAIKQVNWQKLYDGTVAFAKGLDDAIKSTIGWKAAVIGLGLAMTGLLGPLIMVGSQLATLAIAAASNPLILLLMALGAVAYVVWQNWDKISANFAQMWAGIQSVFDSAVGWLSGFASQFIAQPIIDLWNALPGAFAQIWANTRAPFDAAAAWLGQFIPGFVPDAIQTAWTGLSSFFSDLWGRITAIFQQAWSYIGPIVDSVAAAVGKITSYLPDLSGVADTARDAYRYATSPAIAAPGGGIRTMPLRPDTSGIVPGAVAAGAAGAPGPAGQVHVKMDIGNAPAGTRATSTATGRGVSTEPPNVGYSMIPALQ